MNSVKLDTRKLNKIIKSVDGDAGKVVRKIGFAVEAKAKELAPIDLGPLKAGIYVRTINDNQLPVIPAPAERVELPAPASKTEVNVGPSVDYGIYQELGTGKMAAQPYLGPAIRHVESSLADFNGDWKEALGDG